MGRKKGVKNKATPEERFRKGFSQGHPDECWEWFKGTNDKGYGQVAPDGYTRMYTHRYSYSFFYDEELTPSDVVLHTCDNPPCVNPNHLVKGTHQANTDDKIAKGRDRKARGTQNGRSKITEQQAREIDRLIREGQMSLRAIGRLYGIGVGTVIALKQGVTWSHVTGRYAEVHRHGALEQDGYA